MHSIPQLVKGPIKVTGRREGGLCGGEWTCRKTVKVHLFVAGVQLESWGEGWGESHLFKIKTYITLD